MTESQNPTDGSDDATSASQTCFISSRPPAAAHERTLAHWVRAFANCDHPNNGVTPAVLIEPNDSRTTFSWCGTCGAVRVPDDATSPWIRPGLAVVLHDGEGLSAFERNVELLVQAVAGLLKMARSVSGCVTDPVDSRSGELSACINALAVAGIEIERLARLALGDLGLL